MTNKQKILKKRFEKLERHYTALKEYKHLIDVLLHESDLYDESIFKTLKPEKRAILDAYLKRFASIQDFLGAKIFPLLLDTAGINNTKMSEVMSNIEKEAIIDKLEHWIALREVRNELEHDYPASLQEALDDLKYCVDHFERLESYYLNALHFFHQYI